MTLDEAIEFFGSEKGLRKAIGGTCQLIYGWKRKGYIPWASQIRVSDASKNKLKIDKINPFEKESKCKQTEIM